MLAFALPVVLGIASAGVLDRTDWLHRIIAPFLTALNSMPGIALEGLKAVDRDLLPMSHLFGASEIGLFRHVRLPWVVPGSFAGLKLALIYFSAGAVMGDMIAARSGLGLPVRSLSGSFEIAGVMALRVVVAAMVMLLTSLMEWCERSLLAWSKRSTDVPG